MDREIEETGLAVALRRNHVEQQEVAVDDDAVQRPGSNVTAFVERTFERLGQLRVRQCIVEDRQPTARVRSVPIEANRGIRRDRVLAERRVLLDRDRVTEAILDISSSSAFDSAEKAIAEEPEGPISWKGDRICPIATRPPTTGAPLEQGIPAMGLTNWVLAAGEGQREKRESSRVSQAAYFHPAMSCKQSASPKWLWGSTRGAQLETSGERPTERDVPWDRLVERFHDEPQ